LEPKVYKQKVKEVQISKSI